MNEGDVGETWELLVVPVERRKLILKLAHSVPMAGHMSDKKTHALLKRYYTWPGISQDTNKWCMTCPKCQKSRRYHPEKSRSTLYLLLVHLLRSWHLIL